MKSRQQHLRISLGLSLKAHMSSSMEEQIECIATTTCERQHCVFGVDLQNLQHNARSGSLLDLAHSTFQKAIQDCTFDNPEVWQPELRDTIFTNCRMPSPSTQCSYGDLLKFQRRIPLCPFCKGYSQVGRRQNDLTSTSGRGSSQDVV